MFSTASILVDQHVQSTASSATRTSKFTSPPAAASLHPTAPLSHLDLLVEVSPVLKMAQRGRQALLSALQGPTAPAPGAHGRTTFAQPAAVSCQLRAVHFR